MTARDIVMSSAGNAGDSKTYIEDVFSTYLYTGNGSTQTINNGIDLAGKGGMVWTKCRSAAEANWLWDTNRGIGANWISPNFGSSLNFAGYGVTSFNSNGFTVTGGSGYAVNTSNERYASWTFQKAPKFFDVVTYTGNGIAGRTVNHNLGQVPGMMLVVGTTQEKGWNVYHRSLSNTQYLNLSSTDAAATNTALWNSTTPTASVFTVGSGNTNSNDTTYVAYLFSHDTATDGLIQCGSFTGNGSSQTINCGFTNGAGLVLIKRTDSTGDWYIWDTARGIVAGNDPHLSLNSTAAEVTTNDTIDPESTGFIVNQVSATNVNVSGASYIYLAIA